MKQTVGDACGTVATLHALANARSFMQFAPASYITKFLETTDKMSPEDIAKVISECFWTFSFIFFVSIFNSLVVFLFILR